MRLILSTCLWLIVGGFATVIAADSQGIPAGEQINLRLDPLSTDLEPGTWREYRFTGGASDQASVRWTWLESVAVDGQAFRWFETRRIAGNNVTIIKILASSNDPAALPLRVIMQINDMQPVEMPETMRAAAATVLYRDAVNPLELAQAETVVEVPAGTFTAAVYEGKQADASYRVYYDSSLPGMIRTDSGAGRMELVAFGDGDKTAIDGDPRPYTPLPPDLEPQTPE
ncbi:MAG: hypothetical protein OER85_09000 [Gammaproteobacteria bacterium]|nr:hypothetical protein [Gammaproteobacteria bacterium]